MLMELRSVFIIVAISAGLFVSQPMPFACVATYSAYMIGELKADPSWSSTLNGLIIGSFMLSGLVVAPLLNLSSLRLVVGLSATAAAVLFAGVHWIDDVLSFAIVFGALPSFFLGLAYFTMFGAIGSLLSAAESRVAARLASLTLSVGYLSFPLLLQLIVGVFGWRMSFFVIAAITATIIVCGFGLHTPSVVPEGQTPTRKLSTIAEEELSPIPWTRKFHLNLLSDTLFILLIVLNFTANAHWFYASSLMALLNASRHTHNHHSSTNVAAAEDNVAVPFIVASMLTVCFCGDALARFFMTIIETWPRSKSSTKSVCVSPFTAIQAAAVVQAIVMILIPYAAENFKSLLFQYVLAALVGFCAGTMWSSVHVMLIDLFGSKMLGVALSYSQFGAGVIIILISPLFSVLSRALQSTAVVLYACAAMAAASFVCVALMRIVQNRRDNMHRLLHPNDARGRTFSFSNGPIEENSKISNGANGHLIAPLTTAATPLEGTVENGENNFAEDTLDNVDALQVHSYVDIIQALAVGGASMINTPHGTRFQAPPRPIEQQTLAQMCGSDTVAMRVAQFGKPSTRIRAQSIV